MYNVLVVEDDPISADLMTMVLMRMPGLLVDAVGSAVHAREALSSGKHYSMIITDVHLPGEDGLSLAKSIPEMPGRLPGFPGWVPESPGRVPGSPGWVPGDPGRVLGDPGWVQHLVKVVKAADGSLQQSDLGEVRFVPLIGEEGWSNDRG